MSDRAADHFTVHRREGQAAVPCVDVIIAARDRGDTIERAVHSALAEPEVRAVIVVDDGSLDDTAAKANRCDPTGERIIVKRLPFSHGPSAARNLAIEISRGPWLAILDGDDFFLPGRLNRLLAVADGWDFVADDLLRVPEDRVDDPHSAPVLGGLSFPSGALTFETFILGNVTRKRGSGKELGFLKPLMRRSFLDHHGLRYDEALRLGEDYALYARALAVGARFRLLPAAGYASVVRKDSLSGRHSRQDLERLRDSSRDLMAVRTLTASQRRALAKHYSSIDCRVQWLNLIEAVKSRKHKHFLTAFCRSPAISIYLIQRLFEEIWRRFRSCSSHLQLDS